MDIAENADELYSFLPEENAGQSLGVDVPETTASAEVNVPTQLSTSIIEESPSKNPPAHGRYQSRPVKDKPSYVNLMKRCEDVCRCC